MNFTQKKRRLPSINIINLIDIMIVLLMATIMMAKLDLTEDGGIAVDLPKGVSKEVPKTPEIVTVSITSDGKIYLRQQQVTQEELPDRLRALRKDLKDPVLLIQTDRAAPAGIMVKITDIAKQVGQTKLNIKIKGS